MSEPFVSVVTPFRNTAPYLAQCIESVLAQSHSQFEYILSDNCSTDGSEKIAEAYAQRDSRIRVIRQPRSLSQVEHYNSVLAEISDHSRYCKIVQADDTIFFMCLQLMVRAFEQSATIGLVSSYYLKGTVVRGSGFPYPAPFMPGKEMVRFYLRTGVFVFGSPTTVMYRSDIVRGQRPFYDESLLHEDTEKCVQILKDWDFGFVHQVLSFLRTENESISSGSRSFQPDALDAYILAQRYASIFLEAEEAESLKKRSKRQYYHALAHKALRPPIPGFWKYHQGGLKTLGQSIDWWCLAQQMCRVLAWLMVNPGLATERLLFSRRRG